ncbi:MAG: hypothetical protein ACLPWG_17860 [Steroidobacteraceae bacterium]
MTAYFCDIHTEAPVKLVNNAAMPQLSGLHLEQVIGQRKEVKPGSSDAQVAKVRKTTDPTSDRVIILKMR